MREAAALGRFSDGDPCAWLHLCFLGCVTSFPETYCCGSLWPGHSRSGIWRHQVLSVAPGISDSVLGNRVLSTFGARHPAEISAESSRAPGLWDRDKCLLSLLTDRVRCQIRQIIYLDLFELSAHNYVTIYQCLESSTFKDIKPEVSDVAKNYCVTSEQSPTLTLYLQWFEAANT